MVLSRWNRNSFKNFLGLFETSLAPSKTCHPFFPWNPQPSLLDKSHFSGLGCLPASAWLFSYVFDFYFFPVLLRAHQVTGWKRPGTVFTDACWLVSFSATFHMFPLQILSWTHRALSHFNSPFSPVKYYLSLPWKPSPSLSPNVPSSGKLACLLHLVTSVFKLYDSCFLLVTKVKLFEGKGYLVGVLVGISPGQGLAQTNWIHKQCRKVKKVSAAWGLDPWCRSWSSTFTSIAWLYTLLHCLLSTFPLSCWPFPTRSTCWSSNPGYPTF